MEIVHSDASTYEANVEYLTLVEWDEELGVLLADLRDTADGCSPLSDQYEELSDEARAALDKARQYPLVCLRLSPVLIDIPDTRSVPVAGP